ncbi:MAG: GNAT family N-acetyltransferase [Sulfuricurvum sp. GWF2_44_89]|uniref:GNAT family N-acetyltransferase n=1 Tax=Sulfuricurvum kujiense TaxID=148813 RepID=A0A2D3WHI9_9BACT|nr:MULTISPECIES: GNAT family N-acetyltransferase [Sulfuricurvum]OHD78818.1 MAG: GNAT family N-acetyltransferase [Sulfuricurvum sp. GWF2_44_89]OHD92389.1 MAG: GNAT family N-acetyltransferase [Sulfuricurvum sp. RIFOXYD12_FULL_44_77]OHD96762.1 MAG: GNAT family N-acetyltransferase [Sulfuricurvum sp. RIFOXYD2_FULL_44_160]DAB38530.1 MAG TPA: GNAT family N-acetyltransferase [Sulfuricurvum kujiense]
MLITYQITPNLSTEDFIDILNRSTLGERRPVDDLECIESMIKNADIIITAVLDEKIVGVARAVTDFGYCCYLSDLAVDASFQHQGIGKQLIQKVREQLGVKCKLILLSAPAAVEYYPKIGFTQHPSAWVLDSTKEIL